jgi:hypothetical protein
MHSLINFGTWIFKIWKDNLLVFSARWISSINLSHRRVQEVCSTNLKLENQLSNFVEDKGKPSKPQRMCSRFDPAKRTALMLPWSVPQQVYWSLQQRCVSETLLAKYPRSSLMKVFICVRGFCGVKWVLSVSSLYSHGQPSHKFPISINFQSHVLYSLRRRLWYFVC